MIIYNDQPVLFNSLYVGIAIWQKSIVSTFANAMYEHTVEQ